MYYKYCPKCAGDLNKEKINLLICGVCGFHFYLNPLPACVIILEHKKNDILLIKRKYSPKKGYWGLPGGFMNPHENIIECAKREVKEELGVDIENLNYLDSYAGSYLYQGIKYPTLTLVLYGQITDNEMEANDDVSEYKFYSSKNIPFNKMAFGQHKQALKDFIKLNRL